MKEAIKLKNRNEEICQNISKKIDEMIEILESDIKISKNNVKNLEKQQESGIFLEIKQKIEYESKILKENDKELERNSVEKQEENAKCDFWKQKYSIEIKKMLIFNFF